MRHIVVIGGGIVGIASAITLQKQHRHLTITVLEKEPVLAGHQTGRNSGVIHAGIYYPPKSLKAAFCYRGLRETVAFCQQYGIPFDQCGKLLVATDNHELVRMEALYQRAVNNGVNVKKLSQSELKEKEPHISGLGALFSPDTGIVDYTAVTQKMADLFIQRGGEIHYDSQVIDLVETSNGITVETTAATIHADYLIACGGLMADRLAAMSGLGKDFTIIPFQGKYYRLPERYHEMVQHLIYPIPDPNLPFLVIHLTKMIGGFVTVGPNASLVLAREGYLHGKINFADTKAMLGFSGFWHVLRQHFRHGFQEWLNTCFQYHYLKACQKYCPQLTQEDLLPYPAGVRAQAVMADGKLVDDFLIRQTKRSLHVCNAPSPAATAAIPIAEYIANMSAKRFDLEK